jgi:hypothetical protein
LKARLEHVDGIKPPQNKAMKRGQKIHKEAEQYAGGEIKKLPKSLERFKEEFEELRKMRKKLELECSYAVDKDWRDTGWFDPDCWLRIKMDVVYAEKNGAFIKIIDHKTGKVRAENVVQLDLYAAAAVSLWPDAKHIECEFWYIDEGEIETKRYTRAQGLKLQKKWNKEALPMLTDRIFKATPNRLCSWCHYKKSEGGQCKY